MTDPFEVLLSDLGKVFQLKLHVDKQHACSIQIPPLILQLQPDAAQEKLFLFSKLHEIPPGKFRENVLRDALKTNAAPDPRAGVLGYLASTNQLALYQIYPISILSGDRLANLIGGFLEMAMHWHKAIDGGLSAPPELGTSPLPPPFGIKP